MNIYKGVVQRAQLQLARFQVNILNRIFPLEVLPFSFPFKVNGTFSIEVYLLTEAVGLHELK